MVCGQETVKRLSDKSHLLHISPLNPPILGYFYQQIDSCSPQNWGARGAKFSIKKLGRYPLTVNRQLRNKSVIKIDSRPLVYLNKKNYSLCGGQISICLQSKG
ncbi:hypothetical protein BJP34_21570 [Moorena producens PAL-8-15-08-1]|uniref:Uncharacterized protein n=1 Tax=Moorena producens PAL-8-15-08-1 TaxID=1458985 RepID=A0A1D8TVJ2_9CYAN|nr:hypothetical protein BJP34_21570 [Moorena producens PAL-8-15-08-1]